MRNAGLIAAAAALTITLLGGCSVHSAPSANSNANARLATQAVPGPASGVTSTAPAVKPGIYVVRTIWKNMPLSDVRVEWRRRIDDPVPVLVDDTKRIGTAIFKPASGAYFLTAEWRPDGDFVRSRKQGDRFAWFGGNPWLVSSENSEVITLILEDIPPLPSLASAPVGTGIFGRVTIEGAPVAGAGVYAYAKTGTGLRADDFQAMMRTDAKGEFVLDLPPNRYFLLARLRSDNSVDIGPMHKGDMLGYDSRNPVVVEKGRYAASAIPMVKLIMVKSRTESAAFPPGTIEGRIVDHDRHPVRGAYAALYLNADMIGMPVFISEPTGDDGRFYFSVPIPGSYFLCVRSGYGRPVAGSWFGAWSGSADHSIRIKFGEVWSSVEIVVDRLTEKEVPLGDY